ncbi:hypothetical protein D3C79_996660 [compost metagenome]
MRYEKHRAFIGQKCLDQHFLSIEIQMVRRLIKYEEVRWIKQHRSHNQPGFLAAGKHATLLFDIIA